MKRKEKVRAIELRKEGHSLKEIANSLTVAKSSVPLWVREVPLSKEAQDKIANLYTNGQIASQKALRARTAHLLQLAKEEAKEYVSRNAIGKDRALILCSLIYWCEGAKRPNDTDLTFSNSDPLLIRTYLRLLREALPLNESKFRVLMHLHEYHDEQVQLKFWSKMTRIPEQQFTRTYWKPHTNKRIRNGYEGCIHIGYHDVRVSRKVSATARAFLALSK